MFVSAYRLHMRTQTHTFILSVAPSFFPHHSDSLIHTHTHTYTGVCRNLHELTQKHIHSYVRILGTQDPPYTHTTHTHTSSELISVQYGAAFEGSREPVVDEPLNNSLGQA